jgi:ubiquitin C-terminal hydrolase
MLYCKLWHMVSTTTLLIFILFVRVFDLMYLLIHLLLTPPHCIYIYYLKNKIAPELCMAMDVQGHRMRCPIYKENAEKIAARSAASSANSSRSSSPVNVENNSNVLQVKSVYTYSGTAGTAGTRKSSRRLTRSPTNNGNDERNIDPNATKFCALCETEQHMDRVHRNNSNINNSGGNSSSTATNSINKPVAPSDFVHGFIDQAAPESFKVGQQEDSHEFLRLLIEAMQKSCKQTKNKTSATSQAFTEDQANPQDTPTEPIPSEDEEESVGGDKDDTDGTDYPFKLFSGMIESKVSCGYCHTTSSTMDPIEDLGLEVAPHAGAASSSLGGGRRNTPSPVSTSSLADVSHALQRFACAEDLDAGYKCEKCGKEGRATKQMRLASVPPILTLHLKRFRYGTTDPSASNSAGGGTGHAGHGRGNAHIPTRRSQRSSEVSQLIATSGNSGVVGNDWFAGGKSGSAKIEGPSAFKDVLDLKPYLTEELQKQHTKMFSRLFAVIVHVGKNSHSGHYLAYVN